MNSDFSRYHRQMLVPGIGESGQQALADARVLVLGCGALGSVSADLLVRAGTGHVTLADRDIVELTNLQRQTLFDEQDAADALPKAEAARRRLVRVNSSVRITAVVDDINAGNLARYVSDIDLIVDGLDNLDTRYLANDAAVKFGIPYIYAGALGSTGMVYTILPHTADGRGAWETIGEQSLATPCLRCLFSEPPPPGSQPTCETAGVLGPATALVASFQVAQALKVLTGHFARVERRLLTLDLWNNDIATVDVAAARSDQCICCGRRRFEFLDDRRGGGAATLCGRDAVQLTDGQRDSRLDLERLAGRLHGLGAVRFNPHMLRVELVERDGRFTLSVFPDGRAIVHGTSDPAVARSLYARYVGH